MELLQNGITLETPPGTFPLSTDSMVLSDFVRLPKNASVLDLGAGCGTLGLLLCARDPLCRVTGIERDERSHLAALANIERNGLQTRMESICADLRTFAPPERMGTYTTCISNPPYFSGGPASTANPSARRDDCCSAEDLFAAAGRLLRYGGDFFLVHKPDKLAHLCACAARHALEPKQLRLVRHQEGSEVSLILLQCRKGGKPGLQWEELHLFDRNHAPTEHYQRIYHL